ncbi:MAG: tRNA (N6-threonylcarbamoyladenosine(37)-N6)-methyltransferase TrmO [Calditrichota bacterium]
MTENPTAITFQPIGFVHSPFAQRERNMPRQPCDAAALPAELRILPEFREGLADLDGFDRLWVISYFHQSRPAGLHVHPPIDDQERGVFATRSPDRPNPIGISSAKVVSVDHTSGIIRIERTELVDGTPILDIKPYIPESDAFPDSAAGWHDLARQRSKESPR